MFTKRKKEGKEETRAREIAREREKRRKKMLRTKYGQKPLKHAKKGIQSCVLAAVVWFLLIFMIVFSFFSKGNVGILLGVGGIATLILAGIGLNLGVKGFRERDKNYITCRAGAVCNGLVLAGMAAIFIRGII